MTKIKTVNGMYTIDSKKKTVAGEDIGTCSYKKMIIIAGMPGIIHLADDSILNTGKIVAVM